MAEAGVVRRIIIPVVLLTATALGVFNTYADATNVQRLAADTACGGEACGARMMEFNRSPLSHEYVFQVGREANGVRVKCARSAYLLGEYHCEKKPAP
jgi:hypothetical protein